MIGMLSSGKTMAVCLMAAGAWLGCSASTAPAGEVEAPATQPATRALAVHVQTILGSDLPDPKDPWNKAGSVMVCPTDIHLLGDWLYVPCYDSGRICRFKRNPATAAISYAGSQVMPFRANRIGTRLLSRKSATGGAMMYAVYYGPQRFLYWYGVDRSTGVLTEKGKLAMPGAGFALMAPDRKHLNLPAKVNAPVTLSRVNQPVHAPAPSRPAT